MICKNCGTQNNDGVKFCRTCGAPMEQAPAQPAKPNALALVPLIASAVALVCAFLPWYVVSVWGISDSSTLIGQGFAFGDWEIGFSWVLLSLVSLASIAIAAICLFAALKKLAIGKLVAIGGVVAAILTLIVYKSAAGAASSYTKMGAGFYLYIVAMAAYVVVSFLNEKNK